MHNKTSLNRIPWSARTVYSHQPPVLSHLNQQPNFSNKMQATLLLLVTETVMVERDHQRIQTHTALTRWEDSVKVVVPEIATVSVVS